MPAECESLCMTSIAASSCTSPQERVASGKKLPVSNRDPTCAKLRSIVAPSSEMFFRGNTSSPPDHDSASSACADSGIVNLGNKRRVLTPACRSARSRSREECCSLRNGLTMTPATLSAVASWASSKLNRLVTRTSAAALCFPPRPAASTRHSCDIPSASASLRSIPIASRPFAAVTTT